MMSNNSLLRSSRSIGSRQNRISGMTSSSSATSSNSNKNNNTNNCNNSNSNNNNNNIVENNLDRENRELDSRESYRNINSESCRIELKENMRLNLEKGWFD